MDETAFQEMQEMFEIQAKPLRKVIQIDHFDSEPDSMSERGLWWGHHEERRNTHCLRLLIPEGMTAEKARQLLGEIDEILDRAVDWQPDDEECPF